MNKELKNITTVLEYENSFRPFSNNITFGKRSHTIERRSREQSAFMARSFSTVDTKLIIWPRVQWNVWKLRAGSAGKSLFERTKGPSINTYTRTLPNAYEQNYIYLLYKHKHI